VNENLAAALGFTDNPTEENDPKVTPIAVGTVVGSVVPDEVVTDAKGYDPEKLCPQENTPKKSVIKSIFNLI
jgi:hypothetical protein